MIFKRIVNYNMVEHLRNFLHVFDATKVFAMIQFIADANEVMDMLLKTHSEGDLPNDDPQTSYLISAWARICKILGKPL